MSMLSKEELRTLTTQTKEPCISIFVATCRAGPETRQNPIKLKNLLREAEETLTASGMRAPDAQTLLKPAQELLHDQLFWQYQSDGLAIFCTPSLFRSYRLPLHFEDQVIIAPRLHVKPLLPLFANNGRFYVLALSQNAIRLLECTRDSVQEVELQEVPHSMAEALQYDDPEKEFQFFTGTPRANIPGDGASGGDRPAIFYGTGAAADDRKKDDLLRYFHRVDKGLHEQLFHNEQAPLLLAGVEYLLPIYRQANSYNYILEAGITGNPDLLKAEELHAQAWHVIEPYFQQTQQQVAENVGQDRAQGLVSTDIANIVPAAYHGRVDYLFVATDQHQWGTFDPAAGTVHLEAAPQLTNEDLLDTATIHTFLNSGTIYAVTSTDMPEIAPLVAVFRY